MHTRSILRRLFVSLILVLIATGPMTASAVAADGTLDWSDHVSREDVPVQACGGFAITTNYLTNRTYHVVTDHTGATVFERQQVSFSGAIGNATTGRSYAYDGHYARMADYDQGTAAISDLLLRFEVGTPDMVTVSFARVDFTLVDSPPAVIQTIVPNASRTELCSLLGASEVGALAAAAAADDSISNVADVCTIRPRANVPILC
jgi:hypothetical protein